MPSLQGCLAWRTGTDPVDPGTAREQERRERGGRWVRRGRILAFKGAAARGAGVLRARLILGEYRQLEEALWREIERAQGGRVLAQATVIAPSGRLVRHLKQAAAHRFPEGLFGVRFAHVFQFALDLAGDAGGRFVPDVLFYERFLLRWLESPGERPFAGEDVRTYDLAGALHAAIRDMKDAAVPFDPRRLLDEGCRPEEIAVVARTLDPYLAPLAALFGEHRIPCDAPPGRALLDHPLAQAILGLFRAALDDLPRTAALDVVGHPLFRGPADRRHWDLLARSLRIGRGDDWSRLDAYTHRGWRIAVGRETADDRRSIAVPPAAVRALRAAIRRVRHALPAADAGWGRHATAHLDALRRCFRLEALLDGEVQAAEAIRDGLATLARLDALGETIPRAAFVEAFERECRRRRLGAPAPRGVAIVDPMAARGLPFRHVFLLGLNARVFPRFIVA